MTGLACRRGRRLQAPTGWGRSTCALMLWWTVAGAASAQATLPGSEHLSLQQALETAMAQYKSASAAAQTARAARSLALTSSSLTPPEVKVSADRDTSPAANGTQPVRSKIELSWEPPQLGAPALRQQQLNLLSDQASQAAVVAQQRVAMEVRQLHASWTRLQSMASSSARSVALQRRMVATAADQAANARRTRQALIEVQLQAQAVEMAHVELLADLDATRKRLFAFMGQADNAAATVPGRSSSLSADTTTPDLPSLIASAQREHPQQLAMAAQCAALDAETRIKEIENRRWLKSIGASYAPSSGNRAANIGLTSEFTLPVVGPRHGDTQALAAQRQACLAASEELASSISQQIQAAQAQWARAQRAARAQLQQLMGLREMATLVEAARAAGRADDVELLGAKLQVSQGQLQALRRILDAELAEIALQHASGNAWRPD